MDDNQTSGGGLSLIISSLLMILTMVLHPVGGDFDHLLRIVDIGIISHSIGLLAIPFAAYGYWGVMNTLQKESFLARVGFSFMIFGLVAVMIAATLNGLVLMRFIQYYADASDEVIATLKPIFRYNHTFNLANDYIYMTAVGVSMLLWSVAILRTKKLPTWLAYLGLVAITMGLVAVFAGFNFTNVSGFSIFIFSAALWTVGAGWSMWRS